MNSMYAYANTVGKPLGKGFGKGLGLTVVLLMVQLAGHLSVPDAQADPRPVSLDRVEVTDLGDRVRVELFSATPPSYTMSTSVRPASATVDLPGLVLGPRVSRLDVNKPPLLEIVPKEVQTPRRGLQLVFRLANPVPPDIQRRQDRLVIDFHKGPMVTKTPRAQDGLSQRGVKASPSDGTAQRVQKSRLKPTPARQMTRVEVERGTAGAVVKVFGDGAFTYRAKLVDQSRLVVDLAQVSSALRQKVLPVDHPLLKRIRIGQHVDRVRLVLDLPKPIIYTLHGQARGVEIRLGSAGSADVSTDAARATLPSPPPPGVQAPPKGAKKKAPKNKATKKKMATTPPKPDRRAVAKRVSLPETKPRLAQLVPAATAPEATQELLQKRYTGRRISLDFQDADITNVLRLIAEVSGLNIVIGEGVKAKVTMKLVNIPWDQALDMLLKMNNLGMVKEGNIVWIDTLANIAKQQDAEAKAQESRIKAEPLITKVIYIQNVQAGAIQGSLRQHLSPRGQMQVNAASNALILQDTQSKVAEFAQLVRQLDLLMPQVQIEGRIVQADTSYARSFGVQWGFTDVNSRGNGSFHVIGNLTGPFLEPLEGTPPTGEFERTFLVNLPAAVEGLAPIPAVGVNVGKLLNDDFALDMRLSAGELLGLIKTLAAPKITTLDNQQAKIEQGESIPFQTTSLQGTQTTFVDANLTLEVTPQITSRDPTERAKNILMSIKVTRNSVGERSNPAGPSIDKKEAQTQVLVRDGETMVIGGIFLDEQRNTVGGVPYLSRIPVLGWLFKNKSENVSKQELLIFLTPTIVS